jgi:hypothetical protein
MASDPLEDTHHRDTENGFDASEHLGGRPGPGVRVGDAKAEPGEALPSVAAQLGQVHSPAAARRDDLGWRVGEQAPYHCRSSWAPYAGQWMSPTASTTSTKPIGAITVEVTSQPPSMA